MQNYKQFVSFTKRHRDTNKYRQTDRHIITHSSTEMLAYKTKTRTKTHINLYTDTNITGRQTYTAYKYTQTHT